MAKWHDKMSWEMSTLEVHALLFALKAAERRRFKDGGPYQDGITTWIQIIEVGFDMKGDSPASGEEIAFMIFPVPEDVEFLEKLIQTELERLPESLNVEICGCKKEDCTIGDHREALQNFLKKIGDSSKKS